MQEVPATHDALTGLPNRVLLDDRLGGALTRAARNRKPIALLRLDLDAFGCINAEHGRRAGDRVLHEVGVRIRRVTREGDTAARLGGDEFMVIAENVDADVAAVVARRIADAIDAPMNFDGLKLQVEASVGVVCCEPGATLDRGGLMMRSDQALERARETNARIHLEVLGSAAVHRSA